MDYVFYKKRKINPHRGASSSQSSLIERGLEKSTFVHISQTGTLHPSIPQLPIIHSTDLSPNFRRRETKNIVS